MANAGRMRSCRIYSLSGIRHLLESLDSVQQDVEKAYNKIVVSVQDFLLI